MLQMIMIVTAVIIILFKWMHNFTVYQANCLGRLSHTYLNVRAFSSSGRDGDLPNGDGTLERDLNVGLLQSAVYTKPRLDCKQLITKKTAYK